MYSQILKKPQTRPVVDMSKSFNQVDAIWELVLGQGQGHDSARVVRRRAVDGIVSHSTSLIEHKDEWINEIKQP